MFRLETTWTTGKNNLYLVRGVTRPRLEKAGRSRICLSVDGQHLKADCGFGLDDSKAQMHFCTDAQMPRSVKTAIAVLTDRVLALTHLACLWYALNHEEDEDNRALLVLSSDEQTGTLGVLRPTNLCVND